MSTNFVLNFSLFCPACWYTFGMRAVADTLDVKFASLDASLIIYLTRHLPMEQWSCLFKYQNIGCIVQWWTQRTFPWLLFHHGSRDSPSRKAQWYADSPALDLIIPYLRDVCILFCNCKDYFIILFFWQSWIKGGIQSRYGMRTDLMDSGPMRVAMIGSWWMVLMRRERSSLSMEDLKI